MQSPEHGSSTPDPLQSVPAASPTISLAKRRQNVDDIMPLSGSEADLRRSVSGRHANPSVASLYASTLTPPGSRSASPAGRGSPGRSSPGGRPTSLPATGGMFARSLVDLPCADNPGDPLNLLLRAFVPHVAVCASTDTDELIRDKGFNLGFWELLRPFGEQVQGKVTVRDSIGGSRAWSDCSIRFVRLGEDVSQADVPLSASRMPAEQGGSNGSSTTSESPGSISSREAKRLVEVEGVVSRHLRFAENSFLGLGQPNTPTNQEMDIDVASPYYSLYLRRLLSGMPVERHETFGHPVACVIAISSRNPSPIEALRALYKETSEGRSKVPDWVSPNYLRYYVLVHDEDNGDISQSMALFEQMKRNFGLHCHLLRIRGAQSAETDDDSIALPRSEWLAPGEELAELQRSEAEEDYASHIKYIFETDATAIKTFVREMVIQSIIPTMERNVSLWNDQVASKRKGIGGRFMSMSKRWTGFGGGSKSAPSGSNYSGGFYHPDTPEATLRRLADYAFMLRDWKLAQSTYGLLKTDFESDHAWRHHAAANEMGALALLIMAQTKTHTPAKVLNSAGDMLGDATYSYLTRCGAPYGALRCTALGIEMLRLRGGAAIDVATRLGLRLMEKTPRLLGVVGDALFRERQAVLCATRPGLGVMGIGTWRRRSALWSVLAAETWLAQSKFIQAQRCLNEARVMYSMLQSDDGIARFAAASEFMAELNHRLKEGLAAASAAGQGGQDGEPGNSDDADDSEVAANLDEVEVLAADENEVPNRRRSRRQSLIAGSGGSAGPPIETAPLRALSSVDDGGNDGNSPKGDFG